MGVERLEGCGNLLAPGVFDLLVIAFADAKARTVVQGVTIVEVFEGVLRGTPAAEQGEGEGFQVKTLLGCPAQPAGAAVAGWVPQYDATQGEAFGGGVVALFFGQGLGLEQELLGLAIAFKLIGEGFCVEGFEALLVGILLPGDEGDTLFDQPGEEVQAVAFPVEDLDRGGV